MRLASMSRRGRVAIGIAATVVATAALGVGAARLARAQAGPGTPPAPPPPEERDPAYRGPRWETRVLALAGADYASDEFKAITKEVGGDTWRAAYVFQERILARAGAEGWELVQVSIPNDKLPSNTVFYWKRMVVR